ncbi:MAG: hypothetical protein OHK0013_42710 [Sandaracinaceae bacterium]
MSKHLIHRTVVTLTLAALAAFSLVSASADAQARRTAASAAVASAEPSSEGVVNIQTASPEELQRLPGIGPSKAAAIVAFRERTAFRRVEDILRVRGIGRATFRRLRPYLSVSGPTTLTADVTARRSAPAQDEAGADDEEASSR